MMIIIIIIMIIIFIIHDYLVRVPLVKEGDDDPATLVTHDTAPPDESAGVIQTDDDCCA